uniref:Tudor domain-containing protein n=1 Tax=Meloidogyne incognita TaxID=6306 RepID=A0A914MBY1_MELIC
MSTSSDSSGAVLYTRKEVSVHDEVWDDTELIKMYEKSTAKTYEKLQNNFNNKNNTSKNSGTKIKWKIGDHCMAPYEDDGRWYPAKIESINIAKGNCLVTFDGYNTKATVKLDSLMTEEDVEWVSDEADQEENDRKKSDDKTTDLEPPSTTKNNQKTNKANIGSIFPIPDLCPPPPDYLINKVSAAGTDREALTNALMSWYMAGYHTGFYQGLMAQRTETPKNSTIGTKKNEKI